MSSQHGAGLAIIRIVIGIFFVSHGVEKLSWLVDSGPLVGTLTGWLAQAGPWSRWYLESIAVPGAPVFARLVVVGEILGGLALLLGVLTRSVAVLLLLVVVNFHVASGLLFRPQLLTVGLPTMGALLGLVLGGGRLPWSLRR